MDRLKELKDLNLLDRFLFAEASEDPGIMTPILEIILGKAIVLKHLPQAEKEVRKAVWSRIVRMDVLSMDAAGSLYEVEVQKKNTGSLPQRSRAYNSAIDSKLLPPGGVDYRALNDVYIIMVMPFDLFGKGRYRYTFRMACGEAPGLMLNDGATRIFLNTRGTDRDGVSDELIELLAYFEDSTEATARRAGSGRIREIHENVQRIKENEEVGIRFMNAWEEKILDRQEAYEEGHSAGHAEGLNEGALQEKRAIAKNLKKSGIPVAVIAENTGLTEREVEAL